MPSGRATALTGTWRPAGAGGGPPLSPSRRRGGPVRPPGLRRRGRRRLSRRQGGEVFLSDLGGYGGGAGGGAGGRVADSPHAVIFTDGTLVQPPSDLLATASITGQGYACEALDTPPATPYVSV